MGRARGKVRVIRSYEDLPKFKEGEVLVARFTEPTMTIAMNKACAMVTDIGGITSHTAIVAREMGVPCIVATKNATAILKDGQEITVDGTRGEVFPGNENVKEVTASEIKHRKESTVSSSDSLDLDRLLNIFVSGMTAMDPKTCLPFWDYDFAPIFGDLWIKKMLKAIEKTKEMKLDAGELKQLFAGASVPRKELIYSMIDLKVGQVPKEKRMEFVNFYWDIVKAFAKSDPMASKSNKIHSDEEIERIIKDTKWEKGTPETGRACGQIITCLESMAYGLYSDIFPHNAAENYGPYDVSKHFGENTILVIKRFSNLKPVELWPHSNEYNYESIYLFSVYRNMECTIDIYNHQIYSANTAERLVAYAVLTNESEFKNSLEEMKEITSYLEPVSVEQYKRYHNLGFEETKRMWVLQRNYLFKKFFEKVGMEWYDEGMLERVKGKELLKEPFWNFDYHKEKLFKFYTRCFDPRRDIYYKDWRELWKEIVVGELIE